MRLIESVEGDKFVLSPERCDMCGSFLVHNPVGGGWKCQDPEHDKIWNQVFLSFCKTEKEEDRLNQWHEEEQESKLREDYAMGSSEYCTCLVIEDLEFCHC